MSEGSERDNGGLVKMDSTESKWLFQDDDDTQSEVQSSNKSEEEGNGEQRLIRTSLMIPLMSRRLKSTAKSGSLLTYLDVVPLSTGDFKRLDIKGIHPGAGPHESLLTITFFLGLAAALYFTLGIVIVLKYILVKIDSTESIWVFQDNDDTQSEVQSSYEFEEEGNGEQRLIRTGRKDSFDVEALEVPSAQRHDVEIRRKGFGGRWKACNAVGLYRLLRRVAVEEEMG
ncbi:hypothetical protein KSP40_PGU020852 [Platanthera guangdongensis]|uniref:Uncharacterized protein n=1 Tax=Platanthera guangdongensis TaxID=2320717 RepID=A0ABR2MBE4_9ASPA